MWSTGHELARGDGYPQKRCIRGKDDHRWGFRITKFSSRSSEYRRRRLLLYPQNRVLCGLGNSKFYDGLGWNLHLLLRLGIKTRACLPLLFDHLTKARQNEFAVLFERFVSEGAQQKPSMLPTI